MRFGWLVMALVLVSCWSEPTLETADYRAVLNELSTEVIDSTLPLAQAMARGQAPSAELVTKAQSRLTAVQTALDALGSPPAELAAAHTHLTEAIAEYQQAYGQLATNLQNGVTPPFDQAFLTAAAQGGKAVHQAVATLN